LTDEKKTNKSILDDSFSGITFVSKENFDLDSKRDVRNF
jgi:hypothetical protein